MDNQTQTDRIKKHLQAGYTITSLEALQRFGCLRLSARILELKNDHMPIYSRTVKHGDKHFKEYSANPFN